MVHLIDETAKAQEFVDEGKFVVMMSHPVSCPRTDAYIGEDVWIHRVFDSREEALDYLDCDQVIFSDVSAWILPTLPVGNSVAPEPFTDDECPF